MRQKTIITKLLQRVNRSLLQSASCISKCDRLLLQSASGITKCDRLLLQSASGITKCDSYYKVRRNTVRSVTKIYYFFLYFHYFDAFERPWYFPLSFCIYVKKRNCWYQCYCYFCKKYIINQL